MTRGEALPQTGSLTENLPEFRRGLHGLFALLALAVLWINSRAGWGIVERLGGTWPWDSADALLYSAVPLSLVALISFFALAPSRWPGTNSEVELAGPRAWRCGWEPVAMTGLMCVFYVIGARFGRPELVAETARTYFGSFQVGPGEVAWAWLLAWTAVNAATEELAFRVLLQRALEGWLNPIWAVVVQAMVFALVHVFVYDVQRGWFTIIGGLVLGLAFMRTRSFICPFLLHFVGNVIYALAFVPMLD